MPIISTYYNQLWLIDYSNHLPNFHEWFLENNIEIFFFTTLISDWSYYIFLYSRSRNVIDYRNDQTYWKFVNSDWCFSQHDRLHWSLLTNIFDSIHSNAYRNCDYETYRCFWTYETVPFEYIFYFIAINT